MRLTLILLFLFTPFPVLAQEADPSVLGGPVAGLMVMALTVYATRWRAIGSFLLIFYIAMFVGALLTLATAFPAIKAMHPKEWDMFYWWLMVLDYFPYLLASAATWFFGIRLLFKRNRNQKNLSLMRLAMAALTVFSWIGVFVGYRYRPEDSVGNFVGSYAAVVASIWCLYWFVSRRVKHVMTLGDSEWDYDAFRK